ncbi:hypothetical protein D3C81_1862760 [compost metagenome]
MMVKQLNLPGETPINDLSKRLAHRDIRNEDRVKVLIFSAEEEFINVVVYVLIFIVNSACIIGTKSSFGHNIAANPVQIIMCE